MKRIEFIAPVASMRGNLSETQRNIVYPTHDNRAYDGPVGERNTARNYQPIIVGAKRVTGKTYYCVRTKTTNHLTQNAKISMAAMGAGCAILAAMKKDSEIAARMREIVDYINANLAHKLSDRKIFMSSITDALKNKNSVIDLSIIASLPLTVKNPFVYSYDPAMYDVEISVSVIVKFFDALAPNGYYFYVNGEKGIAFEGFGFEEIITDVRYNVLGLSIDEDYEIVKMGDLYLYYEEDGARYNVPKSMGPIPNYQYMLTSEIY